MIINFQVIMLIYRELTLQPIAYPEGMPLAQPIALINITNYKRIYYFSH